MNIEENFISFSLGPILGNGTFGTVHLATLNNETTNPNDTVYVAVKCIDKNASNFSPEKIANEVHILNLCAGIDFVAQLRFTMEFGSVQYIAIDYCDGGDLYKLMSTQGVSHNEALFFIAQVAMGLSELHQSNVVYHDLKLENICMNANGKIQLIDFGLAIHLDESTYNPETQRREIVTQAGTLEYCAPEIFLRLPHAYEADWWSFGVVVYELLSGALPFSTSGFPSSAEFCIHVCSPEIDFPRSEFIKQDSPEESFVLLFLQKNQKIRFGYQMDSVHELWNHDFFQPV